MPMPSKGDRDSIHSRVPVEVKEAIRKRCAARGMKESQYVADLLAMAVGRHDLVRELNQEVLQQTA